MVEAQTLMETPKVQEESALFRSARIKRMEGKVYLARVKADVAALVQQIMHDASRGSIAIEVPEAELDLKLIWK